MGLLNSKKQTRRERADSVELEKAALCDSMTFSSAEAYKMLRTKIGLSIPDKVVESTGKKRGKVIGVSSSVKGEGKSTTSINLSYTLAEMGSRVCLIEADMRLPNIGRRLKLGATQGLSNLLAGQCEFDDVLFKYTSEKNVKFMVLPGGEPSPVPSELLASGAMKKIIDAFAEMFDYVIVDLPPVTIVTDPLIVSEFVDGMLLVVRKGYSDRISLKEALEQFEFSGAKVIGIVMTSSNHQSSGRYGRYDRYGKYNKYGKYGRYGRYGKSVAPQGQQARTPETPVDEGAAS